MSKFTIAAVIAAAFTLSACDEMSPGQRDLTGALGGAAVGLIAADALRANPNWTIVAALGGAAAGVMVARNTATNDCAYADGRGRYVVRPCR
ncbi:MAG: glucose-6-phosphate isomerase [Pararhodobacter sp.]|nr:glucose-6-phosphate isomerase [Pararhodobacter sp.]